MGHLMNQTSSKPTNTLTEAPVLDCDHILTQAGGDPELLIQLCNVFLHEIPIRLDTLRAAMEKGHGVATGRALQHLRNCLIVFGTGPVSCTADTLQSALYGGRQRQARREWKRLQSQIEVLVPQVQRLMLEVSTPRTAVQ